MLTEDGFVDNCETVLIFILINFYKEHIILEELCKNPVDNQTFGLSVSIESYAVHSNGHVS